MGCTYGLQASIRARRYLSAGLKPGAYPSPLEHVVVGISPDLRSNFSIPTNVAHRFVSAVYIVQV